MSDRISRVFLVVEGPVTDDRLVAVSMLKGIEVVERIDVSGFGPCIAIAFDGPIREDEFDEGLCTSLTAFRFVQRVVTFKDMPMETVEVSRTATRMRRDTMSRITELRPALPDGPILADEAMRHVSDLAVWQRLATMISQLFSDHEFMR